MLSAMVLPGDWGAGRGPPNCFDEMNAAGRDRSGRPRLTGDSDTMISIDIAEWLRGLSLEQYAPAFAENAIEWEILPKLTSDDLKEIGVAPVGHRRKLLEAIAVLRVDALPPGSEAMPAAVAAR